MAGDWSYTYGGMTVTSKPVKGLTKKKWNEWAKQNIKNTLDFRKKLEVEASGFNMDLGEYLESDAFKGRHGG